MAVPIKKGAPPSTYAMVNLVEGKPGAMREVSILTAKRMALIWPGVAVYALAFDREMDIGRQILLSGLVSWSITGGLYLYYKHKER